MFQVYQISKTAFNGTFKCLFLLFEIEIESDTQIESKYSAPTK